MAAWDLDGKRVLITGGASGIGLASAQALVRRGARVAILDIDAEGARARAAELGAETLAITCDVTDAASLDAAVAATVERFGGLDVVFANAGIVSEIRSFSTIGAAAYERVIEVNLFGVMRTVRAALPAIRASRGYVLCNASLSAAIPFPLQTNYSSAKAAVENFAIGLGVELAPDGVDVGTTFFGFIDTALVREGLSSSGAQKLLGTLPGFIARPVGPERAAAAVVKGIERRARFISAPRFVRPVFALRGVLVAPLAARQRRDAKVAEAVRVADRGE